MTTTTPRIIPPSHRAPVPWRRREQKEEKELTFRAHPPTPALSFLLPPPHVPLAEHFLWEYGPQTPIHTHVVTHSVKATPGRASTHMGVHDTFFIIH